MLAFTSVYFFESGLFSGLQWIQIRNFLPLAGTRSGCKCARIAPDHKVRRRGPGALGERVSHCPDHSRDLSFLQEKAGELFELQNPTATAALTPVDLTFDISAFTEI
jgi:hypothetical protein